MMYYVHSVFSGNSVMGNASLYIAINSIDHPDLMVEDDYKRLVDICLTHGRYEMRQCAASSSDIALDWYRTDCLTRGVLGDEGGTLKVVSADASVESEVTKEAVLSAKDYLVRNSLETEDRDVRAVSVAEALHYAAVETHNRPPPMCGDESVSEGVGGVVEVSVVGSQGQRVLAKGNINLLPRLAERAAEKLRAFAESLDDALNWENEEYGFVVFGDNWSADMDETELRDEIASQDCRSDMNGVNDDAIDAQVEYWSEAIEEFDKAKSQLLGAAVRLEDSLLNNGGITPACMGGAMLLVEKAAFTLDDMVPRNHAIFNEREELSGWGFVNALLNDNPDYSISDIVHVDALAR